MLQAPNRSGTFLGISNGFGNLSGAFSNDSSMKMEGSKLRIS